MNNMYGMLQVQQSEEKRQSAQAMSVGTSAPKNKKGFFSKLGDALSSNLYQVSKTSTFSMVKKQ